MIFEIVAVLAGAFLIFNNAALEKHLYDEERYHLLDREIICKEKML
ncbi:MAG: hypothetical protein LBT00_08600 [Spirochaetaceae bacterium]|jgi:hypothetical protein|nr:hypothetical protein [Spirochaetaceae bacterium]